MPHRSQRTASLYRPSSAIVLGVVTLLVLCVTLSLCQMARAQTNAGGTERKLQQAREQLKQTAAQRRASEVELNAANARLRQADAQLARASRALAEAEQALRNQRAQLLQAQQRRGELEAGIASQRRQLAQLLRNSHVQGGQSMLKLLLSQQQLADSQRVLAYHRYLQQQRVRMLSSVSEDLAQVAVLEQQISDQSVALETRRTQHEQLAAELGQQRNEHARKVAAAAGEKQQQQSREQALGRDVRSLESVLKNLRAQAARAQQQRLQAERRRAEQQRSTGPGSPAATRSQAQSARPSAAAVRVGGGAWPISGNLITRYGARLGDGRSSTGMLIEAAAGTPVSAVADGRVVYSDWMTGYGMILIVDHGNGYMSLYAHNESLLRDTGASVRRGEQVARVGNSGGQGRNALYFELRRNGQPVDPATWLRR